MYDTAPALIWRAFGSREPEGKTGSKYRMEVCAGVCSTCAAPIETGVPFAPRRGVAGVDNDTFSGYAHYASWGTHVCPACAWLYGDPKRTHRSLLVVGDRGWWPTITTEIEGRPRWRNVLAEIDAAYPDTPMTGVMTTDPKPRLWPRAQLATCGSPGLYLHIPEQDISGWRQFSLAGVMTALAAVDAALALGATKTMALRGLWVASNLVDKVGLDAIAAVERKLAALRGSTEFCIAAVIA